MLRNQILKSQKQVARRLISSSSSNSSALSHGASTAAEVAAAAATSIPKLTTATPSSSTIPLSNTRLVDPSKSPEFLKTLTPMDLISYTALSAMTASPALVKFSTKIMPYTPNMLIKQFVYPIYCGGETFAEVVGTGSKLANRGFGNMMISYSVEDAEGATNGKSSASSLLDKAVDEIIASIDEILVQHYKNSAVRYESGELSNAPISGYIALKPTGLMANAATLLKNHDQPEYAQKWEAYLQQCRRICQHTVDSANGKVVIVFDAEKKALQPGVYAAQRAMMREFNKDGNVIVMGTIQMYLQDSLEQLNSDIADAKEHDYQLALKLVRGAYTHSEPDRWNVVHKTKADTDASYIKGVSIMLDSIIDGWTNPGKGPLSNGLPVVGRVVVASHNEESMALVDHRLKQDTPAGFDSANDESVVFGQLMGMAEDQGVALSKRGHKVIKYVPWGPTKETKDYLVRRLEENGDTVSLGGWSLVKYGLAEFGRRAGRVVGI